LKLICYFAVFMKYWAGLNTASNQEALRNGAEAIVAAAMEVQNTNLVPKNCCPEGIPKPDAPGSNWVFFDKSGPLKKLKACMTPS
jgi:hypothetical protein